MALVNYRIERGIAIVTLENPPVSALSLAVRRGIAAALGRAAEDPAVQAIVLTGSTRAFSAGADINEIESGEALEPPLALELQGLMEASSKPVVAAIEGTALGGGLELALACHWRIAAPSAKVGLPEVKLGLVPGAGGTVRFTRLAGAAAALEALTSGTPLSAARALELQLLDEVADAPLPAAQAFAARAVA